MKSVQHVLYSKNLISYREKGCKHNQTKYSTGNHLACAYSKHKERYAIRYMISLGKYERHYYRICYDWRKRGKEFEEVFPGLIKENSYVPGSDCSYEGSKGSEDDVKDIATYDDV